MSTTPGLGAFNKDKVANKFGIQLKPKDTAQRSSTEKKPITTTNTSTVTKNKTIGDFRTDNSTNGFLINTNRSTSSKTPEPIRKVNEKSATNKSTSGLVNTSLKSNEQSHSLTSNVNHSTTKSKDSLKSKSPTTTKRVSPTPTNRSVSPVPPLKQPSKQKTEDQIEHQKDLPLYRRQLSKPLENTSSTTTAVATTTTASTNSLKR
jgi:hypothetical protein